MALHMIKLCVGVDTVDELLEWQEKRAKERAKKGKAPNPFHDTRMTPKRAEEMLAGGSIYWVIKGQIMCREVILDIRPFTDKDGIHRCKLVLDPKCIPVEPRPRAAFQGWRYLEDKEAPRDLGKISKGALNMPEEMRRELMQLGLL